MSDSNKVKVDWNEKLILQDRLGREGKMGPQEQYKLRMEAIGEIVASGQDHCNCPNDCPHHGKCFECVVIHRGHRDHLPYCFWSIVNESLYAAQRMTEGSLKEYVECREGCGGCCPKEEEK